MKVFFISITLIVSIVIYLYLQNNWLKINKHEIRLNKLPKSFEGYKIIHLSDLHNKFFGRNQQKIISKINKINPDIIVITGDVIDRRRERNRKSIFELIKNIDHSIYYVSGNHEWWSNKRNQIISEIKATGITVLDDKMIKLEKNDSHIWLIGVDDISKYFKEIASYEEKEKGKKILFNKLKNMVNEIGQEEIKLLLSHRPEIIDIYAECDIDLVFSGHAHGGQIRVPFLGGLLSPNQGLLPKYDDGVYIKHNTKLVVNRGLGNSSFPFRINNRPDIKVIELFSSN